MKTNLITVTIETKRPTTHLRACCNCLELENPDKRDHAARIVRDYGFETHVGGRHVAVLSGTKRVAIITHPTAPDFN